MLHSLRGLFMVFVMIPIAVALAGCAERTSAPSGNGAGNAATNGSTGAGDAASLTSTNGNGSGGSSNSTPVLTGQAAAVLTPAKPDQVPIENEAAPAKTLRVGDAAPRLQVSQWHNGAAIPEFEKGKVYVVEFWATWCGPCITAIPHLSEMSTKYEDRDVTFIGMNLREEDDRVLPFLKRMGDKMSYRVAMDVLIKAPETDGDEADKKPKPRARALTAESWLEAAGEDGIPCSFVVDQESRVAWIGHPMMGLDETISEILSGSFDIQKEAQLASRRKEVKARFRQLARANKPDELLAVIDEYREVDRWMAPNLAGMKFQVLVLQKKDYDAAYAFAASAVEGELKDNAQALNEIAWTILDTAGIEKRDFDLALKIAERADELTGHANPPILDTLARAHFEKGDTAKAIEIETLALEKSGDDPTKKIITDTLEKYRKAAAKPEGKDKPKE